MLIHIKQCRGWRPRHPVNAKRSCVFPNSAIFIHTKQTYEWNYYHPKWPFQNHSISIYSNGQSFLKQLQNILWTFLLWIDIFYTNFTGRRGRRPLRLNFLGWRGCQSPRLIFTGHRGSHSYDLNFTGRRGRRFVRLIFTGRRGRHSSRLIFTGRRGRRPLHLDFLGWRECHSSRLIYTGRRGDHSYDWFLRDVEDAVPCSLKWIKNNFTRFAYLLWKKV